MELNYSRVLRPSKIKTEINYLEPKENILNNVIEWSKTKIAEDFVEKGILEGVEYLDSHLTQSWLNSLSQYKTLTNLIDRNVFKKPNKKERKMFKEAKISNKEMTNQIAIPKNIINSLFDNNGIWSKNSIFFERINNIGTVEKYCEYDLTSDRIYEIPLHKLYSAIQDDPKYFRRLLVEDMRKGNIENLEMIAMANLDFSIFVKNNFNIVLN